MELKGLTHDELSALSFIAKFTPWRRDRVSRAVARYLDGDSHALDAMPTVRVMADKAIGGIPNV